MIRLAVLGTGGMANGHARAFKEIKGVKLVSCCDIREDSAKKFAEAHDVPAYYTDLKKMLRNEKLDAITNVTFDAAHYSTCMDIIKHGGIHLMSEKPLATNAKDARTMANAVEKAGIINMV